MLDSATTAALARIALDNVGADYPFHLVHLLHGDADLRPPRILHPAFHGSYDWHSSVHMHWTLVRCARLLATLPAGAAAADTAALQGRIAGHLAARLAPANLAAECDYFATPGRASFERPYGWAWLLALAAELHDAAAPPAPSLPFDPAFAVTPPPAAGAVPLRHDLLAAVGAALQPLAELIEQRLLAFLDRAGYPVRVGTHGNSAFALLLARRYAARLGRAALLAAIDRRALAWFGDDRRWPACYEPGGDDFLSPGLIEAALMAQVLAERFPAWWEDFTPAEPARWLDPAEVSDPTDAKIVHLHGLNLSRAWCWRMLQARVDSDWRLTAAEAADRHVQASRHAAVAGDYVGTHWLASFLLLALTGLALGA